MKAVALMIGREARKAYSFLLNEHKKEVRTLFFTLIKKYAVNQKAIDEEIKREVKFKRRSTLNYKIDTLYFLVSDEVYYLWKYLDRQKKKGIEEEIIKKIMWLSNDKKIEEYLKKRAEGKGDARLAKKVIRNQKDSKG